MPNFFQPKHIAKRVSKSQNVWYLHILLKKILGLEGDKNSLKNALKRFLKASSQCIELWLLSSKQNSFARAQFCFHFFTKMAFSNIQERFDLDKKNSQYESIKEALKLIHLSKSEDLKEKFPSDFGTRVSNFSKLCLLPIGSCTNVLNITSCDLCKIWFMSAL